MNDFQQVKKSVSILDVITHETQLKMKGKHLEECPFCSGHNCFSVRESKGDFKCFQCSEYGDVFTFLEKYLMLDKGQALRKAAEIGGVKLPESRTASGVIKLSIKERIFIESAEYYHSHLLTNGPSENGRVNGRDYFIKKRGHAENVLNAMKAGWTDGGLVEHLRSKGFKDSEIKASNMGRDFDDKKGGTILKDYFRKDLAIFPHLNGPRVDHFTIKDPKKEAKYQLPATARSKQWRFYNQAAFDRYNEVIVVEGENDLLSVMGAGISHVTGIIGNVADYQIKSLRSHAAHKHIYLWLDNDKAGKDYIRKVCTTLAGVSNIHIITYSEDHKDPDEYIKAFDGDKKKEIKRLQLEAVNYLTWELAEIAKLEGLDNKLNALKKRKVFAALADLVEAEKLVFVEKIVQFGLTETAIEEQIDLNQSLKTDLKTYFADIGNPKDADPNTIVIVIYKYFSRNGRFFYDRLDNVYLLYQHKTYEIKGNRPFNALMKKMTGLLPTKEPGRSVWESLASEAYTCGRQIDIATWFLTNRNTDTLYLNLNLPGNNILRISKESVNEVPNGMNDEGVFLKSSQKILPMNYLPDCDMNEGMQVLKELVLDNLTCEKKQKYLILCWLISAFLMDFSPYMALMKFSGATGCGKTTAARLLSILIYGNEHLGDPSTAAAFSISSQNPLLVIDNLETKDITKTIAKFLLLAATKGSKEKRVGGTETDTIQESPRSLVLITAIEPFEKVETINRTYDIEFFGNNKADDFVEDETTGGLIKKRNLILSSIFKFIHKEVLPSLDRRGEYITVLKKEYKNHSKNRTDEYLAILMLVVDKILRYIPFYEEDDLLCGVESGANEIWQEWIEYQDAKAKDSETGSNSIIKQLDGIVKECLALMNEKDREVEYHKDYEEGVFRYTHPEYLLDIIKTKGKTLKDESEEPYTMAYVEFLATAGDIVHAFDKYSRNTGNRNQYSSGSILISRLRNDVGILKKAGWEIISKPGCEPYYSRVKGIRKWKLRKVLVR
ncbi:MAG: toprim domain-containing protein [Planctomycetes bacterium]|nr:toprim domain-containing protein [Planctomycetota bacterium]